MNRTLESDKELLKLRYARSIPKLDLQLKERLTKEGWTKLKEPGSLPLAVLISIPFMLVNGLIFLLLIYLLKPAIFNFGEIQPSIIITINLQSILYLLGAVLFFALHELFHALFVPNWKNSDQTFFGGTSMGLFIYTAERITRKTFIIISVMPYICLSLLTPILLSVVGWLNPYTIFLCLINALASSVDMLNLYLVLKQVPENSLIQLNGPETYYLRSA